MLVSKEKCRLEKDSFQKCELNFFWFEELDFLSSGK